MGPSPQSLHVLDLKGMILENKGTNQSSNGSLWSKVLEAQAMRMRQQSINNNIEGHGWSSRHRKILMKRRAFVQGSRRPIYGIEKRVRTLKKLVPNGKSKALDGLFRETGDYIVLLQMKVKLMEMMVKLLSKTDD
uniref:Putative transcription factor UPBEAT1 n=1 Tax=Davidia involucrata TaxID=16924 RepID=A0A5B7C5I1_DAVIN